MQTGHGSASEKSLKQGQALEMRLNLRDTDMLRTQGRGCNQAAALRTVRNRQGRGTGHLQRGRGDADGRRLGTQHRLCKRGPQLPQEEEQDATGTGSPNDNEVCSQGPSRGNSFRLPTSKDCGCRKGLCQQPQGLQVWGALQPVVGGQTLKTGGRPRKGQTLRIWTGRWGVKVCKQAPHLRSEKHFPDRSRRLSPRPFRHGQALQGWEGEGGGGGDADWKPASREMGGGAWANIHELDNEIQALKKDPDTGL